MRQNVKPLYIGGQPAEQVLTRLRAGDERALVALYDDLYETLFRLGVIVTRVPDISKEIVHDIFLSLWEKRATIDINTDMRVYLCAAVRNRAHDLRKHERVVTAAEDAVQDDLMDPPAIAHQVPTADQEMESEEFKEAYNRALSALTERDRVALRLRWEDDMTLEQIAQVFGVSIPGARGIIIRAQEKVKAALKDHKD